MSQRTTYSDPVGWSFPVRLPRLRPTLQMPIIVALAYLIGAEIAFYMGTLSDKIFAPFWPPNIVLFCALLLVPERRWWLFIAACAPAPVVAEPHVGMPAAMLVAFVTNCAVALISAITLRRLLGDPFSLGNLRKASIYILTTAGFSPAVVALGGAFVPILGGGAFSNYWLFWTNWYLANALTALTLGPVFLTWLSESPKSSAFTPRGRKVEAAIVMAALIAVCTIAFEASAGRVGTGFLPAVLYSPLPLILWAALRFGEKGASGAILIVTVVLIWRALRGPGLFVGADPESNVLALQLFLIGLSIPVLLLGAAIDELRHAEQMTRALAGSVLTAQDQERRRIARELHDSTGQNLLAASMLVGRVRGMLPDLGGPTLSQLDETLRQSIDEVRTVSYLLHPPLLDDAGLKLALRHYVDGFCQRSGITVDLDISPDLDRLASDVELALFRVVQEALTNVNRHSGSTTARIELRRATAKGRGVVILSIADAGKGMGMRRANRTARRSRPTDGVGLASMRERLHQVGGRLDVDSDVGRTVVTATVPDRTMGMGA